MTKAQIAFIGLGNMGGGMAANLVKAGHIVRAYDLSQTAMAAARDNGCQIVATISDALSQADAVVSMLPNGAIVADVYRHQVFGKAAPDALLIDCSTIDVATAVAIANDAVDNGYLMVDAPVSGGIAAASAGTLTFMVGATGEGFARAELILADMGKAIIHAGDAGAGQAAKICNT
jgi:3-hydroxyisobutyrate dehydrogenase